MPSPLPALREPLAGVRVLITRAGDDAEPLRSRLQALGAFVLELPAIAFAPPTDPGPLDAAVARLARYDWIAFSSRRAVEAVFARIDVLGPPVSWPAVAAVGPATAEALEARGVHVDCRPDEAGGAALAETLAARGVSGCSVLLPQAEAAHPALADGLRAAGAGVDTVIAYRTVQPVEARREALDALRRNGVDVVALASPSAFKHLCEMLGVHLAALQYVHLVCIGPTTADAVRAASLTPAAVASDRSLDGLVDAIVALYPTEDSP